MPLKSNKIEVKKHQEKTQDNNKLSKNEIEFLLSKMKTAQYLGAEFEQFYSIYKKLSNQLNGK